MKKACIDEELFVRDFIACTDRRDELIAGLIAGIGRFMMNLPRHGIASRISERLREGPFSDFYDFEMILARSLHPRLASLKLNIIADVRVNDLFDDRFRPYAYDAKEALASGGGISSLREVVARMVRREGHRMAVKFCDLVVKWADPGLYRVMKPLEVCVMDMKEDRRAGEPPHLGHVTDLYEKFVQREGDVAALLLLERMEWDDELREFTPGLQEKPRIEGGGEEAAGREEAVSEGLADWQDEEDSPAEQGPDGPAGDGVVAGEETPSDEFGPTPDEEQEPVTGEIHHTGMKEERVPAPKTRTEKYARILKSDYLDLKDPGDTEGIRQFIKKIQEKNGKAFGKSRAAGIVDEVLAIWAGDDLLDERMRGLIETILEERTGAAAPESVSEEIPGTVTDDSALQPGQEEIDAQTDERLPGDGPVSTGEMEALLGGISAEPVAGDGRGGEESILLDADDIIEVAEPTEQALSDAEETGQLLADLEAAISGEAAGSSPAGAGTGEDSFLIEEIGGIEQGSSQHASGQADDGSYLIGKEEAESGEDLIIREIKDESRDGDPGDLEESYVKDEILFQDEPQKRKKTSRERSRKGIRITKIDISDPDES